jgi:hypothetical protein
MKKKLTSLLLTSALMLALVPVLTLTAIAINSEAAFREAINSAPANTPTIITITGSFTLGDGSIDINENRNITIKSSGGLHTITNNVNIKIENGSKLTLEDIIICGESNRTGYPLIMAEGGAVEIKSGAVIQNQTYGFGAYGVGVWQETGSLVMNGGEVRNNSVGVFLYGKSTLIMNNGSISGNDDTGVFFTEASIFTMNNGVINNNRIGVMSGWKDNSAFIMNGGEINNNKEGGVDVDIFTMNGGIISNNSSGGGGRDFTMNGGKITGNTFGGVGVNEEGQFTMKSGEISYNGWGVTVMGVFNMEGGEIKNNTHHDYLGGGVLVGETGVFNMSGGSIINNHADWGGGGVWVANSDAGRDTFNMTGGVIRGNTADGRSCDIVGEYTRSGSAVVGGALYTTADALNILRHVAGVITLSSVQLSNYGISGTASTADALRILRVVAGL